MVLSVVGVPFPVGVVAVVGGVAHVSKIPRMGDPGHRLFGVSLQLAGDRPEADRNLLVEQ